MVTILRYVANYIFCLLLGSFFNTLAKPQNELCNLSLAYRLQLNCREDKGAKLRVNEESST